MKYKKSLVNFSKNLGFTLIELLVVASIAGIITTFMLISFQRTRVNLSESTSIIISNIRSAQSKSNASTKYNDGSGTGLVIRCGYGVHYENNTSFSIYTGPNATINNCSAQNRNFDGNDFKITLITLPDSRVEFKNSFNDIFFEPPSPTTYINNSSSAALLTITIGKKGGICPEDCKNINVSTSGKIE